MAIDATSGAGGLPVDLTADRRLLLRPAEVLRLRRRAVAGDDVARPRSSGSSELAARPAAGSPSSSRCTRRSRTRVKDQTYNTPAVATLFLLADQIDWMNDQGGLDGWSRGPRASSSTLYGWAERTGYTTPFVTDPAHRSQVVGTIDFDESVDAAASPRRCAPTASSTPSPTASSAATSCGSRCSRRSTRTTSRR